MNPPTLRISPFNQNQQNTASPLSAPFTDTVGLFPLFPQPDREEYGKISHEGRYRVWKEYWPPGHFGKSVRY